MASDCSECAIVCAVSGLPAHVSHSSFLHCQAKGARRVGGRSVNCQVQSRGNCILHNFRHGVGVCTVFGFTHSNLHSTLSLSLSVSTHLMHSPPLSLSSYLLTPTLIAAINAPTHAPPPSIAFIERTLHLFTCFFLFLHFARAAGYHNFVTKCVTRQVKCSYTTYLHYIPYIAWRLKQCAMGNLIVRVEWENHSRKIDEKWVNLRVELVIKMASRSV